jgi:hypothetical protein
MCGKKCRPSWWLLYLLIPMMFGTFWIEMRLPLSTTGHRVVELVIFQLIYALISLWLKANAGAIINEDLEKWRATSKKSLAPAFDTTGLDRDPKHPVRPVRELFLGWLVSLASTVSNFFHS